MPVHSYTMKAGSTDRTLLVYARAADHRPATGLHTSDVTAAFVRDDGSAAVAIEKAVNEIDSLLVPGVYELSLPDEAIAVGATRAMVVLTHGRALFDPVDIDLVMYDPEDSVRLGMTALGPKERIDALRGAFPKLSALELKEREATTGDPD